MVGGIEGWMEKTVCGGEVVNKWILVGIMVLEWGEGWNS